MTEVRGTEGRGMEGREGGDQAQFFTRMSHKSGATKEHKKVQEILE